jgi:hypothetical protein
MPSNPTDQFARDQALAERYRPLLILYPEISTQTRRYRPNWRELHQAPLCEDYHPRDVRLVLDHARIPGRAALHDGEKLLDELESNPATRRIDILAGIGPREEFWAQYYGIVSRIIVNKEDHKEDDTYPCLAYVHVVHGDDVTTETPPGDHAPDYRGLIAIDYWFIYLYNDWKSVHEGDWEHIVVVVKEAADPQGQPEAIACAYSVHDIGYRLPWRDVEKADDQGERADQGTHPVVYVANGSHANYFYGPCHYSTRAEMFGVRIKAGEFPFTGEFTDYTTSFEEGARVFPEAKVVPAPVGGRWTGEWRWLNFSGRWGSRGAGWLPRFLHIGPLRYLWEAPGSLAPRDNWRNPFAWVDHECENAPPLDTWLARQSRLA